MTPVNSMERCLVSLCFLLLACLPTWKEGFSADLELILRGLLREEGFRPVNAKNRVAVGFGSCVDVFADGLGLLKELRIEPPGEPKHHDVIHSPDNLAENFAYFFEHGAATEYVWLNVIDSILCIKGATSYNVFCYE